MGNISLQLNGGSGDQVQWYTDAGCTNSVGIGNPLSIPTPMVTTTYYGRWETASCYSNTQSVTVNIRVPATFTLLPASDAGTRNDNGTNYHIGGLTDDGTYVVLTISGQTVLVRVSDLQQTAYTFASGNTCSRGVARYNDGVGGTGIVVCGAYPTTNRYAVGADYDTTTLTAKWPTNNTHQFADYNAISLNTTTGLGYAVGEIQGTTGGSRNVLGWRISTQGRIPSNATYKILPGSTNAVLRGVSTTGLAIGHDNRAVGGTKTAPLTLDLPTSTVTVIPLWVGGTPSDGRGQGNGISYNGAYATGYFGGFSGGTLHTLHAFRYDTAGGTTQELLPANLIPGIQSCFGYDCGNNGTTVGYSFSPNGDGITHAAVWRGLNTSGELLENILSYCCINFADYGFQYLERCVSMTYDSRVIAGRGWTGSAYRGFVVTFPQSLTTTYPYNGIL